MVRNQGGDREKEIQAGIFRTSFLASSPTSEKKPKDKRYVVFITASDRLETYGGPYPYRDALEHRDAMRMHIENGNYRDWSIPEDTEYVATVTEEIYRRMKEAHYSE